MSCHERFSRMTKTPIEDTMTATIADAELPSAPGRAAGDAVRPATSLTGLAEAVALAVVGVAPLFLVVSGDPSTWKRGVILQVVDVFLIVLGACRLATAAKRAYADPRNVTAGLVALLAALMMALVAHPSSMGAMTVLRFAGAVSLVDVIAHARPLWRSTAVRVWLGWTVFEAGVAVSQKLLGRAIGVPGEVAIPFETLGTFTVPTGTSYGPHPIAAMGLVAIGLAIFGTHHRIVTRRWAVAGAAAGAVIVGVTCGTSGALSLTIVLIAGSIGAVRIARRGPEQPPVRMPAAPGVAPVLIAVALAFGVAAAFSIEGWTFKAERSATTDVVAASNGRAAMIDEAVAMIRHWPALGVGPGRFLATRDAHPEIKALASEDQAVHNVPLLIVTESGALGALALAIAAVAVARRVRATAYALTLLAAMFGHLMFDHAPWTFGFGMVQLALVIGFATARPLESETVTARRDPDARTPGRPTGRRAAGR